ncbi:PAS domain S-box protein [Halomonas sp. HP20-15]|uniref:hybrid sensor histidine kinase/response regulator n=1 Tax=Halomonas sp. HP20-15 TaxID=3085901 RepID=UPI002980FB12|nr:PAS domain S-box protein [Halomonas sp. HP20-15]MDW5377196.1 PAS domain S-box protein [Halomonas sp. HP20-15]
MDQSDQLDAGPTEEGRYRLLVDAVTDYAIFMLDPSGRVISWNPGAQRFKGYQEAEILGQHFSVFYTESDRRAELPKHALATAETEGRFENEGWRVRQDGSHFWANVVIDPIWASSGELIGFAKVTRDLTERKQAEAALARSEHQFRLLVQSVTDYAICMLDPEGRVSNWNQGAQRIKGYAPEEIIGQHFSRFYTEEDRARGEPERGLAIARTTGRFEKEGCRQRKDGSLFIAHVVIDAIRSEDGTLLGYAKVTRDITESRETQKALARAREALFQSQKMESLGQLTGGIAHDFNNLLMVILGSLNVAAGHLQNDPKATRLLNNAIKGAQRGVSLTQRMLTFARSQDLRPEALEVPALVHGMADMLQRSLGPQIHIETRFSMKLDAVMADPNQLELALLNLMVNARDAMPEGGNIILSANNEIVTPGHAMALEPGPYVRLAVTDTGQGMDETTKAKAMDPFFTTKDLGEGTGLGLSMVHGMAEQLAGRLHIDSHKGQGTTVELWLPAKKHESSEGQADLQSQQQPEPRERVEQSLKILAVDDDSLVLFSMTAMLEDLGHQVIEASDASEAIEILKQDDSVDLVITDHAMPKMTGSELAEAIQQRWPHLPLILTSGYTERLQLPAYLPKLTKPFSQDALKQALQNLLTT